ncbi:hypothetical protein CKO42_24560 [Lamprobacter modestohalophilus]|uniref:Uncharacterized protein n=1 Tax=Lamprobacter modestohalophilus TaxID=1064514 RepID=A0A9X1B750_9GAMM|nr:hypothetical protein [Lamprobacter modestohalophilus]
MLSRIDGLSLDQKTRLDAVSLLRLANLQHQKIRRTRLKSGCAAEHQERGQDGSGDSHDSAKYHDSFNASVHIVNSS